MISITNRLRAGSRKIFRLLWFLNKPEFCSLFLGDKEVNAFFLASRYLQRFDEKSAQKVEKQRHTRERVVWRKYYVKFDAFDGKNPVNRGPRQCNFYVWRKFSNISRKINSDLVLKRLSDKRLLERLLPCLKNDD